MVRICFSPVTDHCARSQTQHSCVQPVLIIVIIVMIVAIIITIIIVVIIIAIVTTRSWESIQISSEQRRVAREERSCGVEQTLLVFKQTNNRPFNQLLLSQLLKPLVFLVSCFQKKTSWGYVSTK